MKDHQIAAFISAWFIADGIPVREAIDTAVNVVLGCAVLLSDAKADPSEADPDGQGGV